MKKLKVCLFGIALFLGLFIGGSVDVDAATIRYYNYKGGTQLGTQTNVHAQPVAINRQAPTRDYYTFNAWATDATDIVINNTNKTIRYTGQAHQQTRDVYGTWTPIDYNISYDLAGGSVEGTNPTSYNVESDDITLINPTREGYNFLGWTGTGLTDPTTSVTISTGSAGERSYTANWEAIEYPITYDLDEGTETDPNPTSYTIESEDITLSNPTKEDYEFVGWTGTDLSEPTTTVTISQGSTGEREYVANWKFIYKILAGDSQTHILNVDGDLIIVTNGDMNQLAEIQVDGKALDESNYELVSGSTILTLKKAYLDTLSLGSHKVTFVYEDGSVEANFNIGKLEEKSETGNPQTGDNVLSYLIMLLVSIGSVAFTTKNVLVRE